MTNLKDLAAKCEIINVACSSYSTCDLLHKII